MNSSSSNNKIGHVTYYNENNISPVSQDISDLEKHIQRRYSLHKDLGIPQVFLENTSILEFGPGSGYNSFPIAMCSPKQYTLVEPNNKGRQEIKTLFQKHAPSIKYQLHNSLIEDYEDSLNYHLVIGEGFLSTATNPVELTVKMGNFVKPGGILVITTCDHVSALGDLLRRFIGQSIIDKNATYQEQIDSLIPIYEPLMGSISGMSRPLEDWLSDSVIQPFLSFDFFSIDRAINTLHDDFIFYNSSSPRFNTDSRWYKQQVGNLDLYNEPAKNAYFSHLHNLLDYRFFEATRDIDENLQLKAICTKITYAIEKFENTRTSQNSQNVLHNVEELITHLKKHNFNPSTIKALSDYIKGMNSLKSNSIANWGDFAKFCGRGQQYISFLKKNKPFIR